MLIGWSDVPTGLTSITTERTVRIDALMYKPKQLEVVRVMPQPVVVGPIPDERHPRYTAPPSNRCCLTRIYVISGGTAFYSFDPRYSVKHLQCYPNPCIPSLLCG